MSIRILFVEDNRNITAALKPALSAIYKVDIAATGAIALAKAASGEHQLIILDLHLPDMHGLEICQRLRLGGVTAPILVLTADSGVLRKISLLDAGADDYLTKPFSLGELKARLRALLRHSPPMTPRARYLAAEDITLDTVSRRVVRADHEITLRRKEFALLECLLENLGTVVTREALTSYAWREHEDPWTNTIDVHIKYLRDKIDRPFERKLIKTVHGIGYKLEAPQIVATKIINKKGEHHERPITGRA